MGVNLYDYGARLYDPAIGRWFVVDPLAELAPDWTPYRYGFNNPMKYTDPTGMFEYVKGGYGEDIEISQTYSHTQDGGYRSDPINGDNEHGKVVFVGMNYPINGEGKRVGPINRYLEYEDGTTRNISSLGGFRSRVIRGNQEGQTAGCTSCFEGIKIHDSNFGDLKNGAAVTLPGSGIYLSEEFYKNRSKDRLDLLRHEFGHILQSNRYGNVNYYLHIALVSIYSTQTQPNHQRTWTETEANTLSYLYFNFPSDWNFTKYPINTEYLNGLVKSNNFKSSHSLGLNN
ncbi:hypothetical protein JYB64_19415 [Algoriphagus aestuarii]|nr:hypothetical protein [Algoriphagus aestuarii]